MPFIKNQIVFVNQANLIQPKLYKSSSSSIIFILKRFYFKTFLKNTKKLIVQTNFMKKYLSKSYDYDKKKIYIHNNFNFSPKEKFSLNTNHKITKLLYPANHYPHKNHQLLIKLFRQNHIKDIVIYVTATKDEFKRFDKKNFIRMNYFDNKKVFKIYSKFDAIIFPSLIESLGLPILEARAINMPVICSNLPFLRESLGKKGIYFNPQSSKSLHNAILHYQKFKNKYKKINFGILIKKKNDLLKIL